MHQPPHSHTAEPSAATGSAASDPQAAPRTSSAPEEVGEVTPDGAGHGAADAADAPAETSGTRTSDDPAEPAAERAAGSDSAPDSDADREVGPDADRGVDPEPATGAGGAPSGARRRPPGHRRPWEHTENPRPTPGQFPPGVGPTANPAPDHALSIRSFVPRRSRVTEAQREALVRLWSRWGLEVDAETAVDLEALFGDRPVVMEIGFGMGEATVEMAAADPATGILAVDVHTPGQGNLLRLAEQRGLDNVRVANGDANHLLGDMLSGRCLAGVRVFFPDPWPKKRHNKRRIIQPEFVELCASRMAPGALLHCATDWEEYAEHMLEVLSASPSFENTAEGYAPRPAFRPMTRFEQQGINKGHVVNDLLFRRLP
ncbi:tRNA (guanosine(46)-N7)-methyltransferase TrmB [Streptomyces bohaiensis]|uniref:tRNA (guanosine(46)-N7)-methyltransferase TrmB n=1 Tax=Streptomyces bohaiensis TaxID=1431344 RepID=UPI003B78BF13